MELSTMIKLAMQRYETLESDPLIDNNLKVYVASSSPCIGQYKLTCLQIDSVLLSPAGFELCSAKPQWFFAGRFCLETAWCVSRLRGAPAWAVLSCSLESCVVQILCRLCCIVTLWALSRCCSILPVMKPVLILDCLILRVLRVYSIVNAGG